MARLFKDLLVQESDGKPRVTLRRRDGSAAVEDVSVEVSSRIQQQGDAWGALHANLLLTMDNEGVPTPRTDNPHRVTAAQAAALPTAGGTMHGAITFPTSSGRQLFLLPDANGTRGGFAIMTKDAADNWANIGLTCDGPTGAFSFYGNASSADRATRADSAGRADTAAQADQATNAVRANTAAQADQAASATYAVNADTATSAKGAYGPSFLLGLRNRNAGIVTTNENNLLLSCSADPSEWVYHGIYGGVRAFCPNNDSALNLGAPNGRWNTVYASSSTIATSDRNEKNSIAPLDRAQMLDFLLNLKPCGYKYNDGTSGRTHFGMIAQDVEEWMIARGMDSTDFAGLIKSPKSRKIETKSDETGEITTTFEDIPGEYTYGLRYEEFIAPLIAAVQELTARVAVLEERLAASTKTSESKI